MRNRNGIIILLLIACVFIAIIFFVLHFPSSTERISGKEWIATYQDNTTHRKLELEYIGKDILISSINIRIESGLYKETLREDYDTNTFLISGKKIEFDLSDIKQMSERIEITIKYNDATEKIII
ncbi:hypothetical protein [Eubacterium sp. An3]|uniref:hypothetical protein n=1 Tax=Eubacterium sp. An3 TaxID=1965628 RepID=UPI000B3AB937|nr:hypothetical protein [Eubacterium sp. An3]OUO26539.1 hypothetical protein B5F87_13510 [Eubacterium sp. An3]